MMRKLSTIITLLCFLSCVSVQAQVSVEQRIDSVGILIGQQAHLTVSVTTPQGSHIQWPVYKPSQYITPGVEVLETSKADTTSLDNKQTKVSKVFTLTSFDEKLYPIPGMKVRVNGRTYAANATALKVITVDVDTLHPNQFFPPKDVQDNPFMWSEWRGIFWTSVLMLLLCALAIYMWVRLKQKKPIIPVVRIIKKVPAHQRALNAIDKIKAERLQRSEDQKEYYTQLTDTIRRYINERFGFNAMEMTSSEIIDRLRQSGDEKMLQELRELFRTADLVKFAKYQSLINENDLNLMNAVNFIDETKGDDKPTEERVQPTLSDDDKRSQHIRRGIKVAMWAMAAAVVILLVYVVRSTYLLLM